MAQVNSARQNLPPNHCLLAGQLLSQPPTVLCNYPTQGHKHPCFRGGLVIVSWRWESLKVTPAHKSQWHTNYTSFKYYFTHTTVLCIPMWCCTFLLLFFFWIFHKYVFDTKPLNCFFMRTSDYLWHWMQRVWSLLRNVHKALETGILQNHIYFFK